MEAYTGAAHGARPLAGAESSSVVPTSPVAGPQRLAGTAVFPVSGATYFTYLLYVVFFFLQIPARIPALGPTHPTVVLAGLITLMLLFQKKGGRKDISGTTKILLAFIAYSLVSLPFVEWPGSVLRVNLEEFVKVAVFFFFTVQVVDTPHRLRQFVVVVVALELVRVLEPLYLHVATGYWGSSTYLGPGQWMGRLSGAPADVVNPNGLAFVIISTFPFLYYLWFRGQVKILKIAFIALVPALVWALVLTGSRSGMIGFAVALMAIAWKTRYKTVFLSVVLIGFFVVAPLLSADLRDRYLSIISSDTASYSTVEGRIDGLWANFYTALERPIFGHGLGTSREAAWNFDHGTHVAHNLYLEAFIETGIIGLGIYCMFLLSILKNYRSAIYATSTLSSRQSEYWAGYYSRLAEAIRVFAIMCLVFSMAQYGIREFHWYLMGGLSVVLARLATDLARTAPVAPTAPRIEVGQSPLRA